jgi:glyoxylase-like metal-dependent hydrolase (beta-lactamase superfamily II)
MSNVRLRLCVGGGCRQIEHMVARNHRRRSIRFPAMFAIIEHPREGLALFDTGYAPRFFEATRQFPERLYALLTPVTLAPGESAVEQVTALGYVATDVRTVVISHFHGDHVAGLRDFPRARFRCLWRAWEGVSRLSGLAALRRGFLPELMPPDFDDRLDLLDQLPVQSLQPECAPFEPGRDVFGDGSVMAVELAGHAAGQCGLIVNADDGTVYFLVADACWTRDAVDRQVMPHPIARLLFDDSTAYARTLAGLGELSRRAPSVVIVPTHCERTLAAFVRRQGHP